MTSHPERFSHLKQVTLFGAGREAGEIHEVEQVWQHGERWIFKFRGVETMSAAGGIAGCEIRIPFGQRAELPEGEYYFADLVGCEVIERSTGESLGRVTDWQEYGGPGLLEVGRLTIPFARSICVEIDVAARRIVVELPHGLKDLDR